MSPRYRIAAEVTDVLTHKGNGLFLVFQSEIDVPISIAECKYVQAVIQGDYNDWLVALQRLSHEWDRIWQRSLVAIQRSRMYIPQILERGLPKEMA